MTTELARVTRPSNGEDGRNEKPSTEGRTDRPVAASDAIRGFDVEPSSVTSPGRTESTTATQWWNRTRYQLYAPVYDWLAKPWEAGRRRAIERLELQPGERILVLGAGTGGDLEHLPADSDVTTVDVSPAMVRRTAERAERLDLDVDARVGDARSLPFEADTFDAVLLHLVLSVVAEPGAVVAETARVLRPDGRASIYDKFVPEGEQPSLPRRVANPLARFLFADLNRSLEPMLAGTGLELEDREPFLGGLYTVTVARPSSVE